MRHGASVPASRQARKVGLSPSPLPPGGAVAIAALPIDRLCLAHAGHLDQLRRSRSGDATHREIQPRGDAGQVEGLAHVPIGVRAKPARHVPDRRSSRRAPAPGARHRRAAPGRHGFRRAGSPRDLRCRWRRSASLAPSPRSGRCRTARGAKAGRTHRCSAKNAGLSSTQPGNASTSRRPCTVGEALECRAFRAVPGQGRHGTRRPAIAAGPAPSMNTSKPFLATKRPIAPMTGGCPRACAWRRRWHIDHAGYVIEARLPPRPGSSRNASGPGSDRTPPPRRGTSSCSSAGRRPAAPAPAWRSRLIARLPCATQRSGRNCRNSRRSRIAATTSQAPRCGSACQFAPRASSAGRIAASGWITACTSWPVRPSASP